MPRALLMLGLLVTLLFGLVATSVAGDTYVRGYTRRDGTYVQPYHRSTPDSSSNNNYSTYPNVNPYTGQQGATAPRLYEVPATAPWGGSGYGSEFGGSSSETLGGSKRR